MQVIRGGEEEKTEKVFRGRGPGETEARGKQGRRIPRCSVHT